MGVVKRRSPFIGRLALLLAIATAGEIIACANYAAADEATERLVAIWEGQRSEIVSARIRYRRMTAAHTYVRILDRPTIRS